MREPSGYEVSPAISVTLEPARSSVHAQRSALRGGKIMDGQHRCVAGHVHSAECDASGCDRLEAEGEAAFSRLIADGGDLQHAANHVAGAVNADPALAEGYEALAAVVARAGGPKAALKLFPSARGYAGALACRAALLAAVGEVDEAVGLVGTLIGALPARPWASVAWLADPVLPARLDPDVLVKSVVWANEGIGDPATPTVKVAVTPFYALVREVVALHPENLHLAIFGSSLARRLEDLSTAIAWGEAARHFRVGTDAAGAAMLGSALRRAGRKAEAIELLTQTVREDPAQDYLTVDLAEFLAAEGRPEEGVPWLEGVLAGAPEHEKAAPALHGMRFEIDRDPRHLLALADHLSRHPDHHYAGVLLARHCAGVPWLGIAVAATEAITNGGRHLLAQPETARSPDRRISMTVSAIEAPSAILAVRSFVPRFTVTFETVGEPDPRLPLREVDLQVWGYDDRVAVPRVAAPSKRAAALAAEVAEARWPHPAALYDRAFPLADLPIADLLGLLVHPPAPSGRWRDGSAHKFPDLWIRAVQVIACTGILHYRAEQPWAESERRSILLDLLDGPEDWVTEAAAMALVVAGWTFPDARADVGARIVERFAAAAQAARTRPVLMLDSLARIVLACPWLEDATIAGVQRHLDETRTD